MVFAFVAGILFIMVPVVLADMAEIKRNQRRRWRQRQRGEW
jgi:hypothetical protein